VWPDSYDERVLPSIGNEVLKATVAQFDAAELITQREVVSAKIRQDLLTRAREFNILLEDVSIVSQRLWEWLSVAYHVQKNGLTDTFELVRSWFAMSL
jgi:regulator of protease activity HflC (stomatin/prohibitin superfamily)